jgi:uncharacterized protein YbjT (DUF2867 family)
MVVHDPGIADPIDGQRDDAPGARPQALVFGASGYVGSHLVPRLQAAGFAVRASSRNAAVLKARGWTDVEIVPADALDPASLVAALAGVEVAWYLVHSMAAGKDFGAIDLRAAAHFAHAAAQAGVRRIVYLGGLIPPDADSEHLVSRRDTGVVLRQGPVPVTEVRAGIIIGPGSAAWEVIRDLVNHLPVLLTPRWVRSKSAPIGLDNLLEYLVGVATIDAAAGAVLDVAGPDYITYEDLMRAYGAAVGKRVRVMRVPLLTPTLSAYWLGLVTAVPTAVAQALVGGLKHDLPADDAAIRHLLPIRRQTVRESIDAALAAERSQRVVARWSEGLLQFRGSPDHAFYAKRAGARADGRASAAALWRVTCAIGGDTGYYALPVLWWLRGAIDWLLGGPGLARGRRDPQSLRLGDRVDHWTVVGLDAERHLTLHFGMRAPGAGVLEFDIATSPAGDSTLDVTAYWHPQGIWGLLYWYAMAPAHGLLFRRMTSAMMRRAEAIDAAARMRPRDPASPATGQDRLD